MLCRHVDAGKAEREPARRERIAQHLHLRRHESPHVTATRGRCHDVPVHRYLDDAARGLAPGVRVALDREQRIGDGVVNGAFMR